MHKSSNDDTTPHSYTTIPLTDVQRDILTAIELEPSANSAYNFASGLRLNGRLHTHHLQTALNKLIARHEALRTNPLPNGTMQHVHPSLNLKLPIIDLTPYDDSEREGFIQKYKMEEVTTPFLLYEESLFRAKLLKLAEESHLLLLTTHHLIADQWSMQLLLDNLAQLYSAAVNGNNPALPPIVSYQNYVQNQHDKKQSTTYHEAEAYWLDEFSKEIPLLELPTDHPRSQKQSFDAIEVNHLLDEALIEKVEQSAASQNSTEFTYYLAVFHLLLHRYSGQSDIVVGVPIAGQPQFGGSDLIANCLNILPIKMNFNANTTLTTLLVNTREKTKQGFAHQAYPVGELIKKLPIKRERGRLPLVSVIFNQQPMPQSKAFEGATAVIERFPHVSELYDLAVNIIETDDGVKLQCVANKTLFDPQTIEQFIAAYCQLLAATTAAPDLGVNRLPILNGALYQRVVREWNDTTMPYDTSLMIPDLFAAQAAAHPDKTAVLTDTQSITYGELNQKANQLAHHLRVLGVQPDQFVGVCLERSTSLLVTLLGIHKAGAAYLPMDPNYPSERLAYMLEDTQAQVLITQEDLEDGLPLYDGRILRIDADWHAIANQPTTQPNQPATSQNLAYVIHTSGSTGKPKGVMITHKNVVNFLLTMQQSPGLTAVDRLLAVTTLSFDIAVLELFLPLITGATIILASAETAADGNLLKKAMERHQPTVLQATPATWQMLLAAGWQPSSTLKMLSGGEALAPKLADRLLGDGNELWNMYGPTETTIWSSIWRVKKGSPILIGRPIGNTQMYILNSERQPVPPGVTGELWIGGDGLARGYLNRPEMTVERFVPWRTGSGTLTQIYHTGDLARYHHDGQIECLGRIDFQVKVRGFRIELGEIESQLESHPDIREAVVNAPEFGDGDRRLVAYLLLHDEVMEMETAVLRQHLQSRLPAYMMPSNFVFMDAYPLTPNGKVDRNALPIPNHGSSSAGYVSPNSQTEKLLAELWSELLKVERVGIEDDFFELGGHSLLATQMLARLREKLGVEITLAAFFDTPRITNLAMLVDTALWATAVQQTEMSEFEEDLEEFEI